MGRWGTQPQWGDGPGWDGLNSPQPPKQLGPAAPLTALQEEQVWQEIRAAVGGEEWGEEMLSYSLRAPPWQCSPLRHSLICPHHCTNANAGGGIFGASAGEAQLPNPPGLQKQAGSWRFIQYVKTGLLMSPCPHPAPAPAPRAWGGKLRHGDQVLAMQRPVEQGERWNCHTATLGRWQQPRP